MLKVRILNFLLYQIGWFSCVVGAASARPWLGIAMALILVAVHLWLATDRLGQIKILSVAMGIGLLVDSVLLAFGVFTFPNGTVVAWLPPFWMSVLWLQFATTFRYCLEWLSGRYALSALLGFFGAPLAFLGGERVGAVLFLPPPITHLIMLGTVWCVAIPVLIYASDRIHSGNQLPDSYRGFEHYERIEDG
jgi:hypothetical protein